MAAGIVAVVYPLLEGQRRGWPAWCWLLLGAGVVALVGLFVVDSRHQSRGAATLLPTPLLKVPAFGAGIAVQLFFSAAMTGSILALTLWVQSGQGWSPIHAGLVMTSFARRHHHHRADVGRAGPKFGRNVLVFGAVLHGRRHRRDVARRATSTPGTGSARGSSPRRCWSPAWASGCSSYRSSTSCWWRCPADQAGSASGLFSTAQQLGGAVGVAVISSVFFGWLPGHGFAVGVRPVRAVRRGGLPGLRRALLPAAEDRGRGRARCRARGGRRARRLIS